MLAVWHKRENRRKFFEDYAKEQGFDPLLPQHWYSHPISNLLAVKVLITYDFYSINFDNNNY